jgi:Cu-Zn family superoxide dismutase
MTAAVAFFDPKSSCNIGNISGIVTFFQQSLKHQAIVTIKLSGFKPNTTHGIHIHTWGDLTKRCESSCGHFTGSNRMHGSDELFGSDRHYGDLCSNITADKNGNVEYSYNDELVNLSGKFSVIGRMVVIHQDPDDLGKFRYDDTKQGEGSRTTGNAGKRIACAIIGLTDPNGCS